jgi:hypothetical protein
VARRRGATPTIIRELAQAAANKVVRVVGTIRQVVQGNVVAAPTDDAPAVVDAPEPEPRAPAPVAPDGAPRLHVPGTFLAPEGTTIHNLERGYAAAATLQIRRRILAQVERGIVQMIVRGAPGNILDRAGQIVNYMRAELNAPEYPIALAPVAPPPAPAAGLPALKVIPDEQARRIAQYVATHPEYADALLNDYRERIDRAEREDASDEIKQSLQRGYQLLQDTLAASAPAAPAPAADADVVGISQEEEEEEEEVETSVPAPAAALAAPAAVAPPLDDDEEDGK